jgi:hypothetical protein
MTRYSPFSKTIEAITGEDLIVLKEVAEGWFVDYKVQPIKAVDFGKHLSAFANQFGGWLFVGVQEGPNKSLRAESFPGIPTAEVPKTLVRIREGVSAHVSTPFFFSHNVIDGPVDIIGLPSGNSIIVVQVPEGDNPPYVHSSGRIYRRVGDSSEPNAETDRTVLDSMWRKAEVLKTRLANFVLEPVPKVPSISPGAYSYVYLIHDLSLSDSASGLSFAQFREAVSKERGTTIGMRLDNVFPTKDGYFARHYMGNNDPRHELISLRWWHDGNARLTIPVQQLRYSKAWSVHISSHMRELLVAIKANKGYEFDDVVDFGTWCLVLMMLTKHYFELRDCCGLKGPTHCKIVLSNVAGSIPFVPMQSLLEQLNEGGIPMSQDKLVVVPNGVLPESFLVLPDDPSSEPDSRSAFATFMLAVKTLRAMGLALPVCDLNTPEGTVLIEEFGKAIGCVSEVLSVAQEKPPASP